MDIRAFLRPIGLTEPQLRSLGDEIRAGARYSKRRVRKRHGGYRDIAVPDVELKAALKLLRIRLECVLPYEAPDMVFGYVAGRSIVDNASQHLGQACVVCVDLVDFFGAINGRRLESALLSQGLAEDLVQLLLPILVVDDSTPPGFSTSPMLSNVVFEATDRALEELAGEQRVRYSRYADDLTFSGQHVDDSLVARVDAVLLRQGWVLNPRKTRFMRRGGPQYVTGLYVGDAARPHVPRRIKRRLRAWFHYIGEFGYSDCEARVALPSGRQLEGWLRHVNQVNPEVVRSIVNDLGHSDLHVAFGAMGLELKGPPRDDWDELLGELGL
ncbi:RNA-directed DNA polymerase [Tessaracoccus sp. MC1865]|uniref:reverse transcriptase family protein n=1 Tax=Tessaracoccus sp. MC1865 TaxID=2760310 RepID=UPI0016041D55|nr:reverse transcriptase family protein [Tessaracoccus sp. MC1865]MBB1482786.1 RNA-directed DNA polymerase [Tessaracoccus sp. MC1865]QTO37768.1 RNA-directed DNA polymerase [Tessaracoccus sp. MC1865]